ncbi:phage major capsid protein [Candidatus Pacearchaeota archaeon]|jgi:HK97 family phage major capsid protein|nr:phage major capsid protein [Candidatus Pacearchaeota archaeon]
MKNIMEMKQRAFALVSEARTISDKADAEKREMTAEERTSANKILDDVGKIEEDIRLEERLQKHAMAEAPQASPSPDQRVEKRTAFLKYVRQGRAMMTAEERALVEDTTGQIVVPEDLDAEITRTLGKITVMRNLATVRPTTRDRIRKRSLTEVTMGWGKLETGTGITESTPVPSEEFLYVEDLSGLAKIGRDELQDSDVNLIAFLADSFARAKGETEDTGFTIGTGHTLKQPEGVAVDTDITTIDLITDDVIETNDLLKLKYALPAQYRRNGTFLMNSQTELAIRLLKSTVDGQYLWQPSLQVGTPNNFDGHPIANQDDMNYPADTLLKNVIVFGDFKAGYRVLDRSGMSILRLDELYAEAGLVGFIAYFRVGGGVVVADAFRALKNNT